MLKPKFTSPVQKIAALNDIARTAMGIASRLIQTDGFNALDPALQSRFREEVEKFKDFNPGNDPHGERDFGSITLEGIKIFWKIDYYDRNYEYGSEHPEDPSQTRRVLTLMLAEEY